ncbi:hypothetical protein NKCBBBOE_02698 [Pseudarthrobacter sp. MM222]|nr:hypothetical protein NKCBBBOE_02698 [Pseudarthrobacter sp. MM222]
MDHVLPWADGGQTTAANGAGLCEACNHTKEIPGWTSRPRRGPRHTIVLTTPTGHSYHSTAPPLPGTPLTGDAPDLSAHSHRKEVRHRAKTRRRPRPAVQPAA